MDCIMRYTVRLQNCLNLGWLSNKYILTVWICSKLDEEKLTKITSRLVGQFPNTYTYTKAVAERLVENEIGSIPCAIVRPSCISPSMKEPLEASRFEALRFCILRFCDGQYLLRTNNIMWNVYSPLFGVLNMATGYFPVRWIIKTKSFGFVL